jgi:hypothetical protein
MSTVAMVVAPVVVVVVVIVPPLVAPHVTSTIVSPPSVRAFPHGIRSTIAPDQVTEWLAVCWAADPATTLQEGQVLHNLQVVAKVVEVSVLEVSRCVVVWWR